MTDLKMNTREEILRTWNELPFIEFDYGKPIDKEKKYRIVSMVNNLLTLSTDYPYSDERIEYRFERIGDFLEISLMDIERICSNHQRFTEKVFFCIMDKGLVKHFGLYDYYIKVVNA